MIHFNFMLKFVIVNMRLILESWHSGNASDPKSDEPVNTGGQVRLLYSPYFNPQGIELNYPLRVSFEFYN